MDQKIYEFLLHIIVEAGQELLNQNVVVSSHKTQNDLLTENDLLIEKFVLENIKAVYPEINIISEETLMDIDLKGYTVVVDPIDGTCNFATGNDLFGVQLALFYDEVCEFSAIYLPKSDKLFSAYNNRGAFLNGEKISVCPMSSSDGVLLISDYYDNIEIPISVQFELVKNLQKKFLKTRHFGAACVDFAMLAENKAVAYITYYSKLWDISPGLLLAKEVGLVCSMLSSETYEANKSGLVVANNKEILEMIIDTYNSLSL